MTHIRPWLCVMAMLTCRSFHLEAALQLLIKQSKHSDLFAYASSRYKPGA